MAKGLMSVNGLKQFDMNLRTLMESKSYKEADDVERIRMGGMLLRSKYGIGSFCGFGKTHELKSICESSCSNNNTQGKGRL